MRIIADEKDDSLWIMLSGELGHHEAIQTMATIREECEQSVATGLCLDMRKLTFMDSSGIAVVLKAFKQAQGKDMDFTLYAPEGHIKKILTAAGIDKLVNIR